MNYRSDCCICGTSVIVDLVVLFVLAVGSVVIQYFGCIVYVFFFVLLGFLRQESHECVRLGHLVLTGYNVADYCHFEKVWSAGCSLKAYRSVSAVPVPALG